MKKLSLIFYSAYNAFLFLIYAVFYLNGFSDIWEIMLALFSSLICAVYALIGEHKVQGRKRKIKLLRNVLNVAKTADKMKHEEQLLNSRPRFPLPLVNNRPAIEHLFYEKRELLDDFCKAFKTENASSVWKDDPLLLVSVVREKAAEMDLEDEERALLDV